MPRKQISSTATPASTDEAPGLTQADFDRATYKVGGRRVSKSKWQAAVPARTTKRRVSIMLDEAIIDYFRGAAGERGYQTLINETLRRLVEGESVIADVRLAVREELARYRVK